MSFPRSVPFSLAIQPSQAILFAPAALLLIAAAILTRNFCSRPVAHAKEFPHRGHDVVIYLEYPPPYPFAGEVQAVLEVHRLSGQKVVLTKAIGSRRWANELVEKYYSIEWPEPDLIVLYSKDGGLSQRIPIRTKEAAEAEPDDREGTED